MRKSKFRMVLPVLKHWLVPELHHASPSFTILGFQVTSPQNEMVWWYLMQLIITYWHEPPTLRDIGDGLLPRIKTNMTVTLKDTGWSDIMRRSKRIPDSGSVIAKAITPIETIKYVGHPGSARDSEGWHPMGLPTRYGFSIPDSTMMNLGLYTTKTPVWSGGLKIFLRPWEWTNWSFFNPNLALELSPCLAAWHESLLVDLGTSGHEEWWLDLTFAWHWGYMFDRWGISWWTQPAVDDPKSWCQLNLNASFRTNAVKMGY